MYGKKEKDFDDWNKTRMIMWSNMIPYSKKKITPADIINLEGAMTGVERIADIQDPKTKKERALALKQRYIDAGLLSSLKKN